MVQVNLSGLGAVALPQHGGGTDNWGGGQGHASLGHYGHKATAALVSNHGSLMAEPPVVAPINEDPDDKSWFYIDPQGATQGPCSINQFKAWLTSLETDPRFNKEYEQFKSVEVWQTGMPNRIPLMGVLCR